MQTAFRLVYSLVVAILFVLFIVLGTRTFYAEPDGPEAPRYPEPLFFEPYRPIECQPDGRCFDARTGREITPEETDKLGEEEQELIREQREFQRERREFEKEEEIFISEERAPYHRNVFIVASILGVVAVAAGLALFRRVEAIPLGLMLGGLGVVIFAWAQAVVDFGEIGMAPLFAVVAAGLAVVLAAGYRFLGLKQPEGGEAPGG